MNKHYTTLWHTKGRQELALDHLLWQLISHLCGPYLVHGLVSIVRSVKKTHIIIPLSVFPSRDPRVQPVVKKWVNLWRLLLRPFPSTILHLICYQNCVVEPGLVLNWLAKEYGATKIPVRTSMYQLYHYSLATLQAYSSPYWVFLSLKILLEMGLFQESYPLLQLVEYYSGFWVRAVSLQGISIQVKGTIGGLRRAKKLFLEQGSFPTTVPRVTRQIITRSGCLNARVRIA